MQKEDIAERARAAVKNLERSTKPGRCTWGDKYPEAQAELFAVYFEDMVGDVLRAFGVRQEPEELPPLEKELKSPPRKGSRPRLVGEQDVKCSNCRKVIVLGSPVWKPAGGQDVYCSYECQRTHQDYLANQD